MWNYVRTHEARARSSRFRPCLNNSNVKAHVYAYFDPARSPNANNFSTLGDITLTLTSNLEYEAHLTIIFFFFYVG